MVKIEKGLGMIIWPKVRRDVCTFEMERSNPEAKSKDVVQQARCNLYVTLLIINFQEAPMG